MTFRLVVIKMETNIEVENLSQVEKNIILQVLEKDEVLQDAQDQKVRELKTEVQKIRMQSVLKAGDDNTKMCVRCREEFGFFFNRGAFCPGCRNRICRLCQVALFNGSWLCTLCYKQRQIKFLTGEWANFKLNPLKKWASGSDLVKASLRIQPGSPEANVKGSPSRNHDNERRGKEGSNGVLSSAGQDGDKNRVGYPRESDRHKLTQLLGGVLRGNKSEDDPQELNVKRISSRRYSESDSESSSSSDKEDSLRSSPIAPSITESEIDAAKGLESPRNVESPRQLESVNEENPGLDSVDGSIVKVKSKSQFSLETVQPNKNEHMPLKRKGKEERPVKSQMTTKDARLQTGSGTVPASKSADSSLCSDDKSDLTRKSHSSTELVQESKIRSKESLLFDTDKRTGTRPSSNQVPQGQTRTKDRSPDVQVRLNKEKIKQEVKGDHGEEGQKTLLKISQEKVQKKQEHVIPQVVMDTSGADNNENQSKERSDPDSTHLTPQRSDSPYSISMDSIPSSNPSPTLRRNYGDSISIPESSDTDSVSKLSQHELSELSGTESIVREEGDGDFVVEELSQVRFQRVSKKVGQIITTAKMARSPKKRKTDRRDSPQTMSESSTSQDDSGHASGGSRGATPEHKRTDSGYSQSSIPSSLSTVTDKSDEDEDIDQLVAKIQSSYAGNRGNLLTVVADSKESIASFYSDAGDIAYSNIPVTGEILFGLNYNYKTGMLEIGVKQCRDIAVVDTKRNRSDPYVKTYLLPDKTRSGKRKTKVKKHTLSPTFDETLRYSISKSELENRTLWVTVWHNDRFGRNDFLGEVTINFDYYKFEDPSPKWYPLQERLDSQQMSMLTYKGDLIMSVRFVPANKLASASSPAKKGKQKKDSAKGQLHVVVKEARNLTAVRSNGFSDPFCKGYLLPEKHRSSKQKTTVRKKDCNPVWNHTFVFDDVSLEDLADRCLELTIWDYEKLSSNDFLGGARLNLGTGLHQGKPTDWMDAKGEEMSMWQAMLDRPNIWIDGSIPLRPNMEKRKF